MKKYFKLLVCAVFTLASLYVGLYVMLYGGIIQIAEGIKPDPVNRGSIIFGVIKIFFSASVGYVIFCIGVLINYAIGTSEKRKKNL